MNNYSGRISVVMPAYNEGNVIQQALTETKRVLDEIGCDHEIVIVDDGSDDDTAAEIEKAAAGNHGIIFLRNLVNQGKGHALVSGFELTSGDLVAFLDADLDLHPQQLARLYSIMQQTGADMVIGSKRHPQSQLEYPWYRKTMSSTYYLLTKILFGLPVRDTQTGIKLFRRNVLEDVTSRILVKKYAFDLELVVNANNRKYKIIEAPVQLDFQGKVGRIKPRDVWFTMLDTLAIFYRLYVLKYYDREVIPKNIREGITKNIKEARIEVVEGPEKERLEEVEQYVM